MLKASSFFKNVYFLLPLLILSSFLCSMEQPYKPRPFYRHASRAFTALYWFIGAGSSWAAAISTIKALKAHNIINNMDQKELDQIGVGSVPADFKDFCRQILTTCKVSNPESIKIVYMPRGKFAAALGNQLIINSQFLLNYLDSKSTLELNHRFEQKIKELQSQPAFLQSDQIIKQELQKVMQPEDHQARKKLNWLGFVLGHEGRHIENKDVYQDLFSHLTFPVLTHLIIKSAVPGISNLKEPGHFRGKFVSPSRFWLTQMTKIPLAYAAWISNHALTSLKQAEQERTADKQAIESLGLDEARAACNHFRERVPHIPAHISRRLQKKIIKEKACQQWWFYPLLWSIKQGNILPTLEKHLQPIFSDPYSSVVTSQGISRALNDHAVQQEMYEFIKKYPLIYYMTCDIHPLDQDRADAIEAFIKAREQSKR